MFDAANILGVYPPQPQIERHVMHCISNQVFGAKALICAYNSFMCHGDGSIYRTLVHRTGWNIFTRSLTHGDIVLMEAAASRYPVLYGAVRAKMQELEHLQTARQQAADARRYYAQRAQHWATVEYEERAGLRPVSETSARAIMEGKWHRS